jgi:MFS family permease
VISQYRGFFSVAGAGRLLWSSIVARLPLGMTGLAILLLIRDRTGSFGAAGVAVGALSLSSAAVSPLQGALVDRLGQLRVLVPCALGQAAVLVALVVGVRTNASTPVLVVLAALAGVSLPPVAACTRALWPELMPDPTLREAAFAIDATTQEIIFTVGPLLVAAAIGLGSPEAAVLVAAAITLGGTAAFASSPLSRAWRSRSRRRSRAGALASSGLRALLVSSVLAGFNGGAVAVGLPALAVHAGSRQSSGLLLAVWAFGSMAGGLWYGGRRWRLRVETRYWVFLVVMAASTAPLCAAAGVSDGLALAALSGIAWPAVFASQSMLIARIAPVGTTTEAFTWTNAAFVGGFASGSAVAGPLVDALGFRSSFVLATGTAVLAATVAVLMRRRIDEVPDSRDMLSSPEST